MKFNRRHLLGAMVAGTAGLVAPRSLAAVGGGDSPALLPQAMAALHRHAAAIPHRDIIGLVNFAAHSREPRFQLVDVASGRVIRTMHVAHGSGSDPANTGWVQRFSNRPGSNASSPGSYVTGPTYYGRHGRSRKLRGLDPENCLAESRAIVIHGASYVDARMAAQQGRIGRSQGCLAVSTRDIEDLLELLGPGRLIYAAR